MLGIFVEKVILGIWHAFVSSFDPSQNVLEQNVKFFKINCEIKL